jgi:Zn-dependent protease with chaperone function
MKKPKGKTLRICYAGKSILQTTVTVVMVALLLAPLAWAARTQLKPGWNMFSPQQDIEMGQQASVEAEKQVPMLNDSRVDNYLNNLGKKISAHTPGYKFPYTYKCVNDRTFNAFALPGGHVYINLGVIEAAANEAQLAGVIAHETSHVALRHGTNQATKASAAQVPLAILGGLLGSGDSTGAVLAKLGANFTVNSVLLKYSRTDESEADVMATQILYDSGYDPRAMGQFFEKMQAENKGENTIEFFSSHPDTDNRLKLVDQEVNNLGGLPRGSKTDSKEFQEIKRYVLPLQASGKVSKQSLRDGIGSMGSSMPSEKPSDRVKSFENSVLRIEYPDNWQPYGQGDAVTIAPSSGLVDDGYGRKALAFGVLLNVYVPPFNRQYQQQLQPEGYGQPAKISLEEATDRLIQELRQSNQKMMLIRNQGDIRVAGERAMSIYLSNDSPLGGRETNWLVTLPHTGGLLFIVFTAPERSFQGYENTFQKILRSIKVIR